MKFFVSGDWHADHFTAGVRRYEDVENAVFSLVETANDEYADVFIFLGDLTDPDVGAFWANNLAIRASEKMPNAQQIWLVGNHDVVEDGYGTHAMLPLAAYTTVVSEPDAIRLRGATNRESEVWLLCFPYVSTARSYSPSEKLAEFAKLIPDGSRVIVASHLMLEGIGPGSETKDMARGRDVFLPVDEIQAKFPECVIFNGHYHAAQTFRGVHLPGSIIRLTQSEVGNLPGYLVWNL